MSSVATQLYRSYPVILEMLRLRGYDTAEYPPLALEHIEKSQSASLSKPCPGANETETSHLGPIPPIIVQATPEPPSDGSHAHMRTFAAKPAPFARGSPENHQMEQMTAGVIDAGSQGVSEFASAFRKRYPVLADFVDAVVDEHTRPGALTGNTADHARQAIHAIGELYQTIATPIAEVHFHQCFNPENLWGANIRDSKFMTEMHTMIAHMEEQANDLVTQHAHPLRNLVPAKKWVDMEDALRNELVAVFKHNRTIIFGFRTRNKASETLDAKYEARCNEILSKHGIFVQLFNLKKLMFNPTKHEIVPEHIPLDVWHDRDDVERIKRTFNVKNMSKEFAIIPLNDPIAKFVGLRRGQLCRIPRINDTGGTYFDYRWCK